VGLVAGIGGLARSPLIHLPLKWYVELFRATPVLVLIIWFYYALPVLIGVAMTAQVAAILALSLYGGAFYSEIIRGGIVSIDPGPV
jgi:polar amino acid transport system permease protein